MVDSSVERPKRDTAIDSLRGIAAILMVAGHVIGSDSSRGLLVPDDSFWRLWYVLLEDVRMPLFAALSGFVYAFRPVRRVRGLKRLLSGKAVRLLVPFSSVTLILIVGQSVVPGVNVRPRLDYLLIYYLYGFEHLWFLQAAFLLFVAVGVLGLLGNLRNRVFWFVAVGVSCALFVLVHIPDDFALFSANGALRLAPFFLLGVGVHFFAGFLNCYVCRCVAAFGFGVSYAVKIMFSVGIVDNSSVLTSRMLSLVVGLSAIYLLMQIRFVVDCSFLAWVGGYSFCIYLLHVFGTAGARIGAGALGLSSVFWVFVLALVAGVGFPVAFQVLFGRVWFVRLMVLGERRRTLPRPAVAD